MKVQNLRKIPVGSVVRAHRPKKTAINGVLVTPVHTSGALDKVCVYVRGTGRKWVHLNQIDRILSTPKGI